MAKHTGPDTQNLMIAVFLSVIILGIWQYFVEVPRKKVEMQALQQQALAQQHTQTAQTANEPVTPKTHAQLLQESARIPIRSASLHGSIALKGLRLDDLRLPKYRETLDPDSPEVTLFSPAGDDQSYFAQVGWLSDDKTVSLPSENTVWTSTGKELTPASPLTLTWNNGAGLTFKAVLALDERYMFTITQSAEDSAGKPVALQSFAYINRVYNIKAHPSLNILHEGPLGVFDGTLTESSYKKLAGEAQAPETFQAHAGWLGITDKYWLSTIIPEDGAFTSNFSFYDSKGLSHFQTDYISAKQDQTRFHFFAGAKEISILDAYAAQYHIPLFDRAVDFGWYYFLTKPIFLTLNYFHKLIGNFGVAILLLTVLVKLIMFPLASKSFKSMNAMKTLQPKIKDLQERHKDDKMKLQMEMMELYKKEKINPASGCLPLLIQIPVFFSLYKVLYVTIEMRHAPFFGWIHDLSAPDPSNLFTLFGFAPWAEPIIPAGIFLIGGFHLHLGIWPIIMCATMVIQQQQSPPPPDPTQAKMMKLMPFFFLFLFSSFPAGLVIYWSWNNTLTILQQWYIAKTHGTDKPGKSKR